MHYMNRYQIQGATGLKLRNNRARYLGIKRVCNVENGTNLMITLV